VVLGEHKIIIENVTLHANDTIRFVWFDVFYD